MNMLTSAILITWKRNGAYAMRLVGDLTNEQMVAQPPGALVSMNHPAWILAHLSVYAPIIAAMLRGQPFEDPINHTFGQKSQVILDASAYPTGASLIEQFQTQHDDVEQALLGARETVLEAPTPLERWRAQHPRTGEMVATLTIKHESFHLGQLSAWRRALGLPRVAM